MYIFLYRTKTIFEKCLWLSSSYVYLSKKHYTRWTKDCRQYWNATVEPCFLLLSSLSKISLFSSSAAYFCAEKNPHFLFSFSLSLPPPPSPSFLSLLLNILLFKHFHLRYWRLFNAVSNSELDEAWCWARFSGAQMGFPQKYTHTFMHHTRQPLSYLFWICHVSVTF